jgi:manganese/zinc/iron transport system substrate-binding protein
MERAHAGVLSRLQEIPSDKRYLVTSHDAFHYFTRSYLADPGQADWAERFAAPEGLAPEGQLNPRDIQAIIDFLRAKKISVLFPESNVSRDSIRKIAVAGRELGLEIRICSEPLYGDAMSGLSYLDMMRHNAETIAKYLWNTQ